MSASPFSAFWPCPQRCDLWPRGIVPGQKLTNHHPDCTYVDASMIDVWTVRLPGATGGCIHDNEADAVEMVKNESNADDPLEIVRGKMHREIFDNLPEFDGF